MNMNISSKTINTFNCYIPFYLWTYVSEKNFNKLSPYLDCTLEEFKDELNEKGLSELEFDIRGKALERVLTDGHLMVGKDILIDDWAKYADIKYDGFDDSMVSIYPKYDKQHPTCLSFETTTKLRLDANVNVLNPFGKTITMTVKEAIIDYIEGQMSDGIDEGDQGCCMLAGETLHIHFCYNLVEN